MERLVLRGVVYFLLLGTFFLGLPSFHYTVALMVALIIRYKDETTALFAPIDSCRLPGHRIRLEPLPLVCVAGTPEAKNVLVRLWA